MAARYRAFAEAECRDAFEGALDSLDCTWLTEPRDIRHAEYKLVQLETAWSLGIPVPATCVTNSPREARAFIRGVGDSIVKPIRYGLVDASPASVAWTSAVTADDVADLSGPPVILQSRIRAATHLRVVTVGDRAFVGALTTDALDWRSVPENHSRFVAYPEAEPAGRAREIARALRLGYSSQDWIIDPHGDAWFLEANPSGQWLFLDPAFDGAITNAIADELEGRS